MLIIFALLSNIIKYYYQILSVIKYYHILLSNIISLLIFVNTFIHKNFIFLFIYQFMFTHTHIHTAE